MINFIIIYRHRKKYFFNRIWWTIYASVQRSYTEPYMLFFDHIWLFWKIPYMTIFPYMIHHIWHLPYMIAYMTHLPGEMSLILFAFSLSGSTVLMASWIAAHISEYCFDGSSSWLWCNSTSFRCTVFSNFSSSYLLRVCYSVRA